MGTIWQKLLEMHSAIVNISKSDDLGITFQKSNLFGPLN